MVPRRNKVKAVRTAIATVVLLGAVPHSVLAQTSSCGDLRNGVVGPWDYRTSTVESRRVVEDHHFTPNVESLSAGESTVHIGGDIDYLLRAYPNHARGLLAMIRLAAKEGERPRGSRYTVECWFDRATRFAPNDGAVHMLHGVYLLKKGRKDDAIKSLELARDLGSAEDANLNYNLGLAYLEVGQFDKSLAHAHKAYALGFPLPGLKNRLQRANKWRDPQPQGTGSSSSGG